MKYLLFGTGDYYNRYKKWFCKDEVVALLDNSEKKQNTLIDGIRVCSPEEGIKLGYDRIIILSFYVKAMKRQLLELGVAEDCILHFYDLYQIIDVNKYPNKIFYYGTDVAETIGFTEQKKVLLLSQDLTLGGPSIALMHVAEVLRKQGISVVYGSMLNGPLREKLLEKKIPVIVDEKLQIATMNEIDWVQDFSMILCNTINFYVFLSNRRTDIPTVWWLHDAEFFYDGVNKELLRSIKKDNLKIVSVGPVPQNAIQKYVPDLEVGELLYGVEEVLTTVQTTNSILNGKVRIVTIGFLEDIKGQDVLVKAFDRLPDKFKSALEIVFVGYDNTLFGQYVKEKSAEYNQIQFEGSVDRHRIHQILESADVLVCPSRQDSMPTVAAEAMMHSVPCIVSDVTGTASYITDGEDGFVFASEHVEELAKKITWCIENRSKLPGLGASARRVFEKTFSMKIFEQNLLSIVNDVLG